MRTQIRSGRSPRSDSWSRPRFGMTRALKLSMTTSDASASRRARRTPRGSARFSTTLRLPRISDPERPPRRSPKSTASRRSILITSAPRSARRRVVTGPATTQVKSRTRTPSSGPETAVEGGGSCIAAPNAGLGGSGPCRAASCGLVGAGGHYGARQQVVLEAPRHLGDCLVDAGPVAGAEQVDQQAAQRGAVQRRRQPAVALRQALAAQPRLYHAEEVLGHGGEEAAVPLGVHEREAVELEEQPQIALAALGSVPAPARHQELPRREFGRPALDPA